MRALFLALAALLLALPLASCGPSPARLDRIAPPVRFAMLRETAGWCGGFDPAWWRAIDGAYAEYDAALDEFVRDALDPFVREVAFARLQGRLPARSGALAQAAVQERLANELGERELQLIVALDDALPPAADRYLALLRARIEFRRAVAPLFEPGDTPAGPLEVLALNRSGVIDASMVDAATGCYAELAVAANDANRRFAARFARYCGEKADTVARVAAEQRLAGERPGEKAAGLEAAQREDRMLDRAFAADVRAIDEEFRLALLRVGARFGEEIADADARADYLSRLDAYLHDGVRSIPSMRAAWRIGRRMVEREECGEGHAFATTAERDEALAAFDRIYARIVERDAELRPRLRSASVGERRDAYSRLTTLVMPMRGFLDEHFGRLGDAADRVDRLTFDITRGTMTPDQAVDALSEAAEDAEEAVAEPPVFPGRDRGMQLLLGAPLREGVLQGLAARLRIPASGSLALEPIITGIREELAAATEMVPREIGEDLRAIERSGGTNSVDRVLSGVMSGIRARTERVRALDRAANERALAEIARAAGVKPDDERIEIARLELDLLSEIGGDRGSNEAEQIGGLTAVALVNPLEVVRSMGADEAQRAVAESIVLARGDELRAAHRTARQVFERNIRGMLRGLIEARGTADPRAPNPWRPELAGHEAVALRFAIADELGRVLGPAAQHAYLVRLRELAAPGMEPLRARSFFRLDRFAAGVGLPPAQRAASADIREVLAEFLDGADERRHAAAVAALAWRADWIAVGNVDSRDDWRRLSRFSPLGWLLWSRLEDADERAIAVCIELLSVDPAFAGAITDASESPIVLPRQMSPYFDERR
jgi:hypothetical protein